MRTAERDLQILEHIVKYAEEIEQTINRFGASETSFNDDYDYRNSVSMSIMQIGELSKHLASDFKSRFPNIPWHKISGMRNHFAHGYSSMDNRMIWQTATENIPMLK